MKNYIVAGYIIHNIIIDEKDEWTQEDGVVLEECSSSKNTGVLSFDVDADGDGEERREEVKEKVLEFLKYA